MASLERQMRAGRLGAGLEDAALDRSQSASAARPGHQTSMSQGSMPPEWALKSAVARLATVDGERPHMVPVVFCALDGALYIPVDGKPKSGTRLKRLRNIERNPAVAILIDRYSDDWSELSWTRIDGRAEIVATDDTIRDALETKYPQYEQVEIGTTAIRVTIGDVVSWSAKESVERP